MTIQDYIQSLNAPQRQAVTHHLGPLLVLAGAGSGKTRVLTYRIAHLIDVHQISPDAIVALTFTNRAALEMRQRVDALLKDQDDAARVIISTFHSLGARLLRRYARQAGLDWNFTIYDDTDQRRLIGQVLEKQGQEKSRSEVQRLQNYLDAQKNAGITPRQAAENSFDARAEANAEFYTLYQQALDDAGAVDFGDLILRPLILFRNHPALARRISETWQFVMVDEFQDTNQAQFELLNHLTSAHDNLTVVGDDDQAIYGWRGADPRHILGFEDAFSSVEVVKLEQNYRSTSLILDAANDVIAHNEHRHAKRLWTEQKGGEPIVVFSGADDREEAAYVVETIFDLLRKGADPEEIAIFYRTNAQGRLFEEQLRQWGIPYRIIGGLSFYAREEIKDLLAYLRAALNPDDDVATARIINTPRRGVGNTTIEKLRAVADIDGVTSLQAAIELHSDDPVIQDDLFSPRPRPKNEAQHKALEELQSLTGVSQRGLKDFQIILQATRDDLLHFDSLTPVLERLIERIGYRDYIAQADPERAEDRLRNIGELVNAVEEFETDLTTPALLQSLQELIPEDEEDPLITSAAALHLRAFLDRSALVQNQPGDTQDAAVTMMTIHGAKGLEFDQVFVVGMEDELFPNIRDKSDPEELAEERRLAYVAITRAKQRLYLTNARQRRTYGQFHTTRPSRFLLDINPDRLLLDPRSASPEIDYTTTRHRRRSSPELRADNSLWNFDQSPAADPYNQAPPDWEQSYIDDIITLTEPTAPLSDDDMLIGATVSHSKFGIGEVKNVSGTGDTARLLVDFPAAGEQTVIRKFLKILG